VNVTTIPAGYCPACKRLVRDNRLAVAVIFGCAGVGAAIACALLAVYVARNGGKFPAFPRLTVAVTRPVPAYLDEDG